VIEYAEDLIIASVKTLSHDVGRQRAHGP